MTFKYRYRKQIVIGFSILILIIISTFGVYKFLPKKNTSKKEEKILISKTEKLSNNKNIEKEKEKEKVPIKKIMIDIKGSVASPGIYEFDDGKRVIDAINAAGGVTENADTSVLNLSKILKDEMVIIVYSYEEVLNFTAIKEEEKIKQDECTKGINDIKNDACIEEETVTTTDSKLSINKATLEELMLLDGVGESKAKAIIEYREKNGEFKELEDLLKVTGIGEGLFAKIKENITL